MKQKENKSLFLECFGDTPQLRVLDFLIDNHFFDFPMTEIARGSNVSYNSIILFFKRFIDSGIIIQTRKVGKSDYYKLNLENHFVKNLIKIDWSLVEGTITSEIKPIIHTVRNKSAEYTLTQKKY
ncbi:MAG: hypothetical protein AABW47_00835 [Nanoarchaeota archaeon]